MENRRQGHVCGNTVGAKWRHVSHIERSSTCRENGADARREIRSTVMKGRIHRNGRVTTQHGVGGDTAVVKGAALGNTHPCAGKSR